MSHSLAQMVKNDDDSTLQWKLSQRNFEKVIDICINKNAKYILITF